MSRRRFHGLKKIKFRMTWNKYNLYNLSRMTDRAKGVTPTYFQQKWAAKSASRAYHGEQIREKQWQRMFTSRLNAVVPMDHRYLAEHDGSELAAGRGSGKDVDPKDRKPRFLEPSRTPYMHMTYAPTERRLDIAIFRALFASSARQARQFVVHGGVKVNGKKMPYPGYLLNPGDMFQVDPDRVMFATGKPKDIVQIRAGRSILRQRRMANVKSAEAKAARKEKALQVIADRRAAEEAAGIVESQPKSKAQKSAPENLDARKQRKADFQDLMKQIETLITSKTNPPSAKKRRFLRAMKKEIRSAMSKLSRQSIEELDEKVVSLMTQLGQQFPGAALAKRPKRVIPQWKLDEEELWDEETRARKTVEKEAQETRARRNEEPEDEDLSKERRALTKYRENPVDDSKPYATPWSPRPYMSAFAFIPRYLEVNHKICSAVYLRHPVARPGLAEVPSPFSAEQMQLAFNWYLRRR